MIKTCKGLISPESCTHAHNDKTGFVDEQGCTWSAEEVSKADGIVKFSELVSGEYIVIRRGDIGWIHFAGRNMDSKPSMHIKMKLK